MALHIKLFGRDIVIGKRLYGLGKDEEFYGFSERYSLNYDNRTYLDDYKGVVYACIKLIGESMGGMYNPVFYRRRGDQLEDIGDHEFLRLLKNPSNVTAEDDDKADSLSMFDLIEATANFIALQGECFWYMALGQRTGIPREIIILRPDRVGIDIDRDTGDVVGYFVKRMGGEPIKLEVREVLHFKDFNPKNPYHGLGVVKAGKEYIGTDEQTSKFTNNFFKNNAGVNGVLALKGVVAKGAFQKFVRAWRSKYEGSDNAGKTAIMRDTDASFTKVGLGLNELDMSALRKMSKDDVMMMFRVPKPLLGTAEDAGLGRGNVEALEYIFAKYNLDPKMKKIDAILEFALKRYWNEPDIIVKHTNIIPDDKEFELNVRDKSVDRWKSRNEIRDEDGLDSVDGGDDLRAPINSVPLTDVVQPEADDTPEEEDEEQAALWRKTDAPKFKRVIRLRLPDAGNKPKE